MPVRLPDSPPFPCAPPPSAASVQLRPPHAMVEGGSGAGLAAVAAGSAPAAPGQVAPAVIAAVAGRPVQAAVAEQGRSEVSEPVIKRAAALRCKYRLPGCPVRIVPDQLGFHPCNRDGQPPNAERCNDLCGRILQIGFDSAEADAGGVCVCVSKRCQAAPPSRGSTPRWRRVIPSLLR